MQSCCYGTYAAHQEVVVCAKIGGERAEGEEGGEAGGGAEDGTEGEEESIWYQEHGQGVGGHKISIRQLNITHG